MKRQEKGGYSQEDARWHHAAVYLGESRLCEATSSGVHTDYIYKYIGSHLIRVRRGCSLNADDGWKIALNAMFRLGAPYSYGGIGRMFVRSIRGFWNKSFGPSAGATKAEICSKLYADAYTLTTSRVLENAAGETPTPAALSATGELADVATCWREIG